MHVTKIKKKMYLMGSSVYSVWPRKGSVNLKIGQQKSPKLKFQENKELKKKKQNRISRNSESKSNGVTYA